jgi:hypothetical protein
LCLERWFAQIEFIKNAPVRTRRSQVSVYAGLGSHYFLLFLIALQGTHSEYLNDDDCENQQQDIASEFFGYRNIYQITRQVDYKMK